MGSIPTKKRVAKATKKLKRDRFAEAIGVLAFMRRFAPELPDAAMLLRLEAKALRRLQRGLLVALGIAEANADYEKMSDQWRHELCKALCSLPESWPANAGTFIRNFHEVANHRPPTVTIMNAGGHVEQMQIEPLDAAKA